MSIYKDHLEDRKAAAVAAETAEKLRQAEAAAKSAQKFAEGRTWLETIVLPELADAKAALVADLIVDFSETIRQKSSPLLGCEITFTINRRTGSQHRSYVFAVTTDEMGMIRTEVRRPHDEGGGHNIERMDKLSGNVSTLGVSNFQDYLKLKITDALKL